MIIDETLNKRFSEKVMTVVGGVTPEPEYALVRYMRQERFSIIDVGANLGISSLYFLMTQSKASVYAFEPNSRLHPYLDMIRCWYSNRMFVYHYGLSDKDNNGNLYVPLSKEEYYSGLGSLDVEFATNSYISVSNDRRLHLFDGVESSVITLRKADCLDLPNDCRFVKIDIEGHEKQCLSGMIEYISRIQPILLVESFQNADTIISFLSDNYFSVSISRIAQKYGEEISDSIRNILLFPKKNHWKNWLL